ncbi:MAG: toll/interleukin-1 receptor domain-containing protein, partial [Pseudomonadota bacterium]
MTDVFVSYKKEDVARVQPIAEALAQAGYDVWWDHRIPPGRTYRDVIGAALDTAKCVIVVWSDNSTKSQWVLDEADVGAKRRVLLPILIDNIMPPLGFTQIEAARLLDWSGDTEALEWKHTVEAVGHLVGRAPGTAPPVQISMPSSGGATDSAAMLRATPGALADMTDTLEKKEKKGGGAAGWIVAAVLAIAVLGGGGYYAITNNLFSGSLPPGGQTVETDLGPALVGLHLSADSQADLGAALRALLVGAGHEIRDDVRVVGDRSPNAANQVRFFHETDRPLAQSVVDTLNGDGQLGIYTLNYIPELGQQEAMGNLEVWLQFEPSEDETPSLAPNPAPPAAPQSRFGDVTAANVKSVVMPDGMVLGVLPDGRWGLRFRGGELEGTYRETDRANGSV